MARGYPDWSNPDYQVAGQLVDLGALFVGLTNFAPVDGLGRVFYWDNFKDGFNAWNVVTAGDATGLSFSLEDVEIPPASMGLNCGTLGGSGSVNATWQGRSVESYRLGVEVTLKWDTNDQDFWLYVARPDPDGGLDAQVKIDRSAGDVSITTPSGDVSVLTLTNLSSLARFMTVKLVCDFENGIYERLIVGENRLDLTDYSLNPAGATSVDRINVTLYGWAKGAGSADLVIGHIAVTIDEP